MAPAGVQVKHWTFGYYFKMCKEGYGILYEEISAEFNRKYKHVKGNWGEAKPTSSVMDPGRTCNLFNREEQVTSLLYGSHVLSRLLAACLLWVPSFIADIQHGTQVSGSFAAVGYTIVLIGFVCGITLAKIAVEPSLAHILPGLIRSVYELIATLVSITEIGYISFGMFSLAYVIYQRDFLQQFILYHSSILSLPKSYQRRTICWIFVISFFFSLLSEPLFVIIALYQDIDQSGFLPYLDRSHFIILKLLLIASVAACAALVSLVGVLMPTVGRFLIVATAKHLQTSFQKQIKRQHQENSALNQARSSPPTRLVALVDKTTSNVIEDFSCQSLTSDWPPMGTSEDEDDCPFESSGGHHHHHGQTTIAGVTNNNLRPHSTGRRNSRCSSACGGLLFLYKNLVKSLSELKGMIDIYEEKFGTLHVVLVCLQGLIVAQWVVAGLTQARLIGNILANGGQSDQIIATINGFNVTPFTFRVGIGIVVFVVSNVHVFLVCDRLPDQMRKMQSQLFKINVHLALSGRMNHLGSPPREDLAKRRSMSRLQIYSIQSTSTRGQPAHEWNELDHVWSVYDQFVRMAKRTNFRLTPTTFYNKNCLLTIFGREISLILLYIQMVDIYTYIL